jgi:hypothetical protein
MNAVIKVEATRTRLFLVVVIIGVAFLAASLLEQLLRRGELPREVAALVFALQSPDALPLDRRCALQLCGAAATVVS